MSFYEKLNTANIIYIFECIDILKSLLLKYKDNPKYLKSTQNSLWALQLKLENIYIEGRKNEK